MKYPLTVVYCGKCGLPPEYCEWAPKAFDYELCKKWLAEEHPDLHAKLYPVAPEGTEESKEDDQPKKKKKAVKIAVEQKIRVIRLNRGKNKIVCQIIGLETFDVNTTEAAKQIGKKFGTGAAYTTYQHKGIDYNCVQVQGDIEDRFEEYLTKDLAKYKIPYSAVEFEEGGNFKTK